MFNQKLILFCTVNKKLCAMINKKYILYDSDGVQILFITKQEVIHIDDCTKGSMRNLSGSEP